MIKREFNPATSSNTHSQARENAEITGLCADGQRCGTPPEIGDEAYCIDCPNRQPSAVSSPSGTKHDEAEIRFDLLLADMPLALEAVVSVLTYGAGKYNDGNWQYLEDADRRYLAASMRHEMALHKGDTHDDETGEHHLAHKLCCDLFRLELALRGE
jgi:hypothetical protein